MAVKIRLKRMGMKKHPFYRIVVTPSTASSLLTNATPAMAASSRKSATTIP